VAVITGAPATGPLATQGETIQPQPLPWRVLARDAAWLWLVWQIILIAFTYTALTFQLANSQRVTPAYIVTPASFYQAWIHLDGNWYLQIATQGYSTSASSNATLAFFPLYPLLVHLATFLCFGNAPLAAILVARLADYGVCLGILALAWQELRADSALGRLALAITLAYPMAFYLGAAYTEPLVLAEVCFALLFARRHAWGLAALVAFLAGLTHSRGLVLFLPLAWEWARAERPWEHWREWRMLRRGVLVLGAAPLGYLSVLAFDAVIIHGNPLAVLSGDRAGFGRVSLAPWQILRLIFGTLYRATPGTLNQAYNFADIGLVLLISAIVAVAAIRQRMPGAFVLYSAGLILGTVVMPTPNGADAFLSAGRALIPSVPAFLVLASWCEQRPWLLWLVIGGGLCLETTLAAFFLNGGWLI
jgi:hypothetical protein